MTVFAAIQHLKRDKRDDSDLISNHFVTAAPAITGPLANFSLFCYVMVSSLPDCVVLVAISKPGKNPSSDSYRPITLASTTLSKILEWCSLLDYSACCLPP